jgi:hypothetical protein
MVVRHIKEMSMTIVKNIIVTMDFDKICSYNGERFYFISKTNESCSRFNCDNEEIESVYEALKIYLGKE